MLFACVNVGGLPRERAKEILAFERVLGSQHLQPQQDYKMRCSHGLPTYRHLWAAISRRLNEQKSCQRAQRTLGGKRALLSSKDGFVHINRDLKCHDNSFE